MDWRELKNNPAKWEKFLAREKIIKSVRDFFYRQNFREVETPVLVPAVIPESYLDIFSTYSIDRLGKKQKMFLTPSPEVSLKKLLAATAEAGQAGLGDCFEITKSFRNRETGGKLHNPEFTMLEWYRLKADYRKLMNDCEKLFVYIADSRELNPAMLRNGTGTDSRGKRKNVVRDNSCHKLEIIYQKRKIDLTPPWKRISVPEALQKYAGFSFDEISSLKGDLFPRKKISALASKKGYVTSPKDTWERIFNQIFLNEIESRLAEEKKPVILYDYPRPMAALAKIKKSDPRLAERLEIYAGGLELADGYTELTDWQEQKKRFQKEMKEIKKLKKTPIKMDEDFLAALKSGLPPCAGMALGLDRLVMLLTDSCDIAEVRFFTV